MTHSYEYRTLLSGSLFWVAHSPEHFIELQTLLSTLFSDLLLRAILWDLVWAVELVWSLFWALKRVHSLLRALFWVDLLSRVLFWALFGGLSVHQNLPLSKSSLISCWVDKPWRLTYLQGGSPRPYPQYFTGSGSAIASAPGFCSPSSIPLRPSLQNHFCRHREVYSRQDIW